ncbi:MAG: aspartate ammonia-lyase [Candidatus Edwardsbacteria bacterium RIFOXYD12_FULL_50_11]|uniref:Aspartate ammonia-lyase n=1 Tax=Candidatus Edwardsbacteria bacterium GWF2_54_11 TaxID=1817851 RepID=A0A1F5R8V0_9BACT|nr:MAG: aspartate ammonia-lyase [Candidatus Edwardsbacteria bacterium RifOxyC12_full_54_24]OGF07813.1 MAG: aspartate ammonia-lyase [Candidatus Edwardsbacteria bacterium RifOxyA12_full_54_48]OGF10062.1 MAG: aspartate ammonia-lyase [Candidatus Edwardsbacteria bacterium GWE2_54_12]OGF10471.1 MAG: aspartate ammonia-lyase [Candidatus Edwardsbacteria bacterium GWF2_54_11]OGF14974.1 MAG: aspartate ammonia-lyase [Candidatus Edwardsbacteria bacterium RIFOXYD12_FULL_50_11]OGJ19247.1 MAG: aspartate ammon
MSNKEKLNTVLSGVSGEYFVAAELSKRGYIASITLRNTKGVDILCSNAEATKTVGIQVKTSSGAKRSWILNQKAEKYFADNLFYIFVNLYKNKKHPDYFIVPSKVVSKYCKKGHSNWLRTPGKRGQKHNDTPMRKFHDPEEEYLNRWELLNL